MNLELLISVTLKLFVSTERKTTKHKNGEDVPQLEINEEVLVNCSIVNNQYQHDSRFLRTFVQNKHLSNH